MRVAVYPYIYVYLCVYTHTHIWERRGREIEVVTGVSGTYLGHICHG